MNKKKILLIDDELMLLMSMQRMLENTYEVTIVTSAREAITLVNKSADQFDLIICDIYMPEMNGIDFYNEIQKKHAALAKRIIFMTGANLNQQIQEFLATNQNKCISKPFESASLMQTIKDFI